jgi:hypothetical protein
MSDWKKDAVAVGPGAKPDWMSEAHPVAHDPNADTLDMAGIGQAALEHFANPLLLGYLPHIQAAIEKGLPRDAVDDELEAKGFKIKQPDQSYTHLRDENIKRMKQQEIDHPVASEIGSGAGFVTGVMLPSPLGAAKGASFGQSVIKGAKTGAAMGALQNPGDTEGDIEPINLRGRASNALEGAVYGAAVPVAQKIITKGSNVVSDYLRNKAELKATRALGRPTPTQAANMSATGQDKELGRQLLDDKAIPVLGTPEKIGARIEGLKEKAGQDIGALIDSAGSAPMLDSKKLADFVKSSPYLNEMRKTPGMEGAVSAIEKQLETLAGNGQLNMKEALALRQRIDQAINFNQAAPDMKGAQEGLYKIRTAIRDAMNEKLNTIPGGPEKDALIKANRKYGNLATAEDIIEREMGRNQANRGISLTDTVAGAGGLASGGPVGATLAGGLNKLGRTYGNSVQARVYDAISKKLAAVPGMMEKTNPQQISEAFRRPMQEPGFARDSDPILNDPRLMDIFKTDPSLIDAIDDETTRQKVKRAIAGAKRR